MNISYAPDYESILIVLIFSVASVLYMRKHICDTSFRDAVKETIISLLAGLIFVLISTIVNSLIENQWNNNYIISFLLLKKVSNASDSMFPRHICAVGYVFIIFGIAIISISLLKKRKEKTE